MGKRGFSRLVAGVTFLIGMIGVSFSGFAIVRTWRAADQLRTELPVTIGQLETVVISIQQRGEAAVEILESSRDRLDLTRRTVEDLATKSGDRQLVTVLDSLDQDIVQRLDLAEEFVRSMLTSLENASSALLLLESIPFLSPTKPGSDPGDNTLKELAAGLSGLSHNLRQVTDILHDIRTRGQIDPTQIAALRIALTRTDQQLAHTQRDISSLTADIDSLASRLTLLNKNIVPWTRRTAELATVFLVCFGWSQLNLVRQASRSFTQPDQADTGQAPPI